MAYIDTSVLVAAYYPERLSGEAERAVGSGAAISTLTEVEFCSAIALRTRTGEIDPVAGERVISLFRSHVREGHFEVLPILPADFTQAADWIASLSTPLRVLDAIQLAAAHSRGLTFLTSDKALARAAGHFGVKHRLLS